MKIERIALGVAAVLMATAAQVAAQGFATLVSPPRFELRAKPGDRLRQVVEISNAGAQSARLGIKTADWSLDPDYSVSFTDALQPGSCRPWVSIERREVTVAAGGKYRYRFEIAPPADAATGECRFALLLEGDDQEVKTASGLSFPVTGRIGVIVYVALGNASPVLEVVGSSTATLDDGRAPILHVKNTGNAHGRIAGFLSGKDARGRDLDFTPSTLPILPGETRPVALKASLGKDDTIQVAYPITIRGALEWADKRVPFEQRFE
jgi:hypothetical protein